MIVSYFRSLSPAARALLWAIAAGLIFSLLNTQMRVLTFEFDPFQTQFLRYLMGLVVMLPLGMVLLTAVIASRRRFPKDQPFASPAAMKRCSASSSSRYFWIASRMM